MLAANLVTKQQMPILNANAQNWTLEEVNQRRMRAQGAFLSEEVVWLDNRPRPVNKDGEAAPAGFYVMMPLRLENGQILWVNRGWAPRNGLDRVALPAINTPKGVVSIEGTVFATPGKVYEFGNRCLHAVVQLLFLQLAACTASLTLDGRGNQPLALPTSGTGARKRLMQRTFSLCSHLSTTRVSQFLVPRHRPTVQSWLT